MLPERHTLKSKCSSLPLRWKEYRSKSARMAFQIVGDQLQSLETITFNNKTKPPRTLMNPEGNFRFSKAPGIMDLPHVRVTAPGSSMPLVQAPLESADGQSYYSLYPLKPGITTFEVQQASALCKTGNTSTPERSIRISLPSR